MKKHVTLSLFIVSVLLISTACSKVKKDTAITVRNTIQIAADPSNGGTGGVETAIEGLFQQPENSLQATANFSKDDAEFPGYLLGLYDIDFGKKSIHFRLAAEAGDPTYGSFFRIIEAGTFDRYYFNFDAPHRIKSGESDNSSVAFRVISDNEVVVEIGEGFNFNPGTEFTIDLK